MSGHRVGQWLFWHGEDDAYRPINCTGLIVGNSWTATGYDGADPAAEVIADNMGNDLGEPVGIETHRCWSVVTADLDYIEADLGAFHTEGGGRRWIDVMVPVFPAVERVAL